ncbi:MAG: hypothetical protein HY826_08900 [Actinobacteria bacterium]|nr:hypothetical protein [Actinomycetota bacterium]
MSMRTRLLRLLASWVLVAIGVPLLVRAELGVAPFDVLNTGMHAAVGWSLGLCFIVDAMVFFAIGWALGVRPGWASFVGTLVIGPLVNVMLAIVPEQHRVASRLGLLGGGILIVALAICLVVTTELGAGPTEVVMLGLFGRGLGIVPSRWISDGVPFVIGMALGGAVGPGTLIFAVGMGPMVQHGLYLLHYEPRRLAPRGADALGS